MRAALAAGAPIARSAVVGPGQRGFLAAVLRPGTRAVTIELGAGTSHAGLVDPGDRVDVILTAGLKLAGGAQGVFTRTILEDVRVLAVDRQIGVEAETADGGKEVTRTKIVTATLEVSPSEADRLALGDHEGLLSLAVRPLAAAAARPARSEAVDLEELLSLPTETERERAAAPAPPPPPLPLPSEPETRTVLAAARHLAVGTLLGEDDMVAVQLKAGEVRRGHVVAEGAVVDALRGYAVREALAAGAPLTRSAVVGPGRRGFLAAVLRPGTRAVTRHAGLIDPGDRVDVILTAKLKLDEGGQGVFTRTILQDVRVVAVDRRVGSGAQIARGGEPVKRSQIVTATLEVSPPEADLLALGEHEGSLSLAVRSLAAAAAPPAGGLVNLRELLALPEPPAASRDDAPAPAAKPAAGSGAKKNALAPPRTVRVIRGDKVTEQAFPAAAEGAPR